ncbi:MAG: transcriptional repressor LexA [Chloroflexi bacterium]|nr:transcriptional repressor LexA [Chloroflexota bacterium]
MKNLTPRQYQILEALRDFLNKKGYPPTVRDIQRACGISSTSVVDYNLKVLERMGYLRRDREVSRGIDIGERERRTATVRVPVAGYIAAGEPIPVPTPDTWHLEASAEALEVAEEMIKGREEVFALKVKGTSMVDAYINDGDVVLMQAAATANDGDMVAAWLKKENEVTLKRIYREGGRIRLQPANIQMSPLYLDPDEVEVQGRVIGVLRWLD